jgi:hypothetical protein
MRREKPFLSAWRAALALLAVAAPALLAQEKPAAPAVTLESIQVEPAAPRPDTLCHLSVGVRNAGDRPVSALELTVTVDGKPLPAYRDRVFFTAVEPGTTRQLRLFNFWSTEAGRPAPSDGKLTLEVALVRASWMQRETQKGETVWTPAGAVAGLPSAKTVVLQMTKQGRLTGL